MKKLAVSLLTICVVFWCLPTKADLYDGNTLSAACAIALKVPNYVPTDSEALAVGVCLGTVVGIYDVIRLPEIDNCRPPSMLPSKLIRIVLEYLNKHPDKLNERNSILVMNAYKKAFQCE